MPKMKTKESFSKRFHATANGKLKYKKQGLRHILTKKSTKRKRNLRHAGVLSPAETRKAKVLLPYQ